MPPDCYKVEIIHYLNPHLMWIEVRDPSVLKEEFLFEQIGIYSVLPSEITLDVLTKHLALKSQECEEWLPAASVAMKNVLDEAHEVWFAPVYTDRRTTIFDDNIHKYGEIILKTRNGKLKKLSKHLIKSGFAHHNVCEFHKKLICGKLKTKLDTIKTQEVIKELENYCLKKDRSKNDLKKSVQKQTSVFQMCQDFEMSLTELNLEKHNNKLIKQILINKYKDFELCKDIDDEPLGRACSKIKPKTPESKKEGLKSKSLIKQLSIAKKMSNSPKTEDLNQSYNSVMKFLNKESIDSECECEKSTENKFQKNDLSHDDEVVENLSEIEMSLTESNLEKHNNKLIKQTLINKHNDFESCMDIDDEPLGRACSKIKPKTPESKKEGLKSKSLIKQLSIGKKMSSSPKTEDLNQSYNSVMKFLNKESIDSESECEKSTENKFQKNDLLHDDDDVVENFSEHAKNFGEQHLKDHSKAELNLINNKNVMINKTSDDSDSSSNQFKEKTRCRNDFKYEVKSGKQLEEKASSYRYEEEKVNTCKTSQRSVKPTRHKSGVTIQVAYGPPGLDPKFLKIQDVTIPDYEEEEFQKQKEDIENVQTSEKCDMYGEVDSEIGIEITNKKTLKDYLKKRSKIGNLKDSVRKEKDYEKSVTSSVVINHSDNSNERCVNYRVKVEKNENVKSCAQIVVNKDNIIEKSNNKTTEKEKFVQSCIEMSNRDNSIKKINKKKIQNESKSVDCGAENNSNHSVDKKSCSLIKRKLFYHKAVKHNTNLSSSDTSNKDSSSDVASNKKADDDDNIEEVFEKFNLKYKDDNITKPEDKPTNEVVIATKLKNNVNPFKNADPNISVFVDKLVTPVLMVHSKHDKRIQPVFEMRDIYLNSHIQNILRNMSVEDPMALQSISWSVILKGYSLFMISPMASGKTIGYLPAVCRLVSDSISTPSESGGPVSIIVCATAQSVTNVEKMAKIFLRTEERVLACYAGVDNLHITTALLNGCDLLIATPSSLVRLLQTTDFGVDLRRLSTFVLDDCERLSEVYADEIKFFTHKIKEMLKMRANKDLKVQYILASRIWCEFMEPLAKKVPDTIICIGAFQECVLYSKTNTTVTLVKKENKVDSVFEFLNDIIASKRTVIVCESNDEVALLEKALKRSKHVVFSCNNDMTIHDLYNLSVSWADYNEPLIGPILICCDSNLVHMNITDAHYLIHYSMPPLFSMFCKRFSVLNDNYPSIFKTENENVKIKILIEENNVQQLPKILNFIKRCTGNVPSVLDEISSDVLKQKDVIKAKKFYPLCDSLLTLGYCPDIYNCQERHTILKDYDTPKDWLPKQGTITCKVLYYHSATLYSARILSCTVDGKTTNYPQTYNKLSLKMGMYYSKESNKKLHGIPEIGDICATSIKLNFFVRCQVLKILNRYERGTPNTVLVKLIDEERLEVTRDIYLYYLPDELKQIESRVVQLRLANIEPKDKDITFSELARERLKKITDMDTEVFVRGNVSLTLGNCVFVNTLEACQDLTSLNEVVVKYNLKQELLQNHAIPNPDHLSKLEKLCTESGLIVKEERNVKPKMPIKNLPKGTWAHLESDSLSSVFFTSAINPDKFFIRLAKFESCMTGLLRDIKKYVDASPSRCDNVKEGDIILAKCPDDNTYERARIDRIKEETARCFFVDQGDWREIPLNNLMPITEQFINQLPFQAIECRLVGIRPLGEQWTDFSSNWFIDNCYDDQGGLKYLYVKYFTKDPAEFTSGHKYSVAVIDTNTEQDSILNQLMIDLNLARKNLSEVKFLYDLEINKPELKQSTDTEDDVSEVSVNSRYSSSGKENDDTADTKLIVPSHNVLLKPPIRSVPLVNSDESEDDDRWDVVMHNEYLNLFPALKNLKRLEENMPKVNTENLVKSVEKSSNRAENLKLDSDDLTSPDNTFVIPEEPIFTKEIDKKMTPILDLRAEADENKKLVLDARAEIEQKSRPKLVWRQNKTTVTIKIQLIGADNYELRIEDRALIFSADVNDTEYSFELELYGIVHKEKCSHVNKGQYIMVKLKKVLTKTWLTLTKDGGMKKWIVYDLDSLDASSDEESVLETARGIHDRLESESEDEDFEDDIGRGYKKYD